MSIENGILYALGLAALYLAFQKWFWIVAFFIGALASAFAVLASIIHFQILGALGYTALAVICSLVLGLLVDA